MIIYIFFGKSGCGKSFLGNYLQNHHHFFHFDGDNLLTPDMKNAITKGEIFSQSMVDNYTHLLKSKIKFFYKKQRAKLIIISQGLYRNKNRLAILKEFPLLQFVFIHSEDHQCFQRIKNRNNEITVEYATKISSLFESPEGFNFIQIENNLEDSQETQKQLNQLLKLS